MRKLCTLRWRGVDELRHILQHVVYDFDDAPFTKHHPVIERHETAVHVRAKTCHNMYAVMPKETAIYIPCQRIVFQTPCQSKCR